jgi:small-conductance mechanosensitive channel
MPGPVEIALLIAAAGLSICGVMPALRSYRSLFWGGGVLLLTAVLFPRPGNRIGEFLFADKSDGWHLPSELFGIAWWILGAWLVKSLLAFILRRTIFPDDNQPHARRIYADLGSGLVYVVAFVGIVDTVLGQPVSAVLAASGVFAIVLGLALQNTLADVFAGLAINIERPFAAGDWITVKDAIEGQVMEVNWRATRIRTSANDIGVIPNSVIARAIVTNHRRINEHVCSMAIKVDHRVSPARVIGALLAAAGGTAGIVSGTSPHAYGREFSEAFIIYDVSFVVEDFVMVARVQSELITRIAHALRDLHIGVGTAVLEVPWTPDTGAAVASGVATAGANGLQEPVSRAS